MTQKQKHFFAYQWIKCSDFHLSFDSVGQTAYSILDKDAIKCNFEEEEDDEDENTPSVINYFKKQTPQLKSNKFFTKHNMKRVDSF